MKHPIYDKKGFTLLELVISMTLGALVLGSLISTFVLQRDRYEVQEQYKDMAYTARAAMDMISRDVASAGYSPSGLLQNRIYPKTPSSDSTPDVAFVGIPYNADMLEIISDLDGDGNTDGENEWIRYRYVDSLDRIERAVTSTPKDPPKDPISFDPAVDQHDWVPFAENIQGFTFKYLQGDSTNEVTSAGEQSLIRAVQLAITARAEKPDADFSQNNGYRFTTLISDVKARNLGLKKPSPSTTSSTSSTSTAIAGTTTTSTTTTSSTADVSLNTGVVVLTTEIVGTTSDYNTTTTGVNTTTVIQPTDCTVDVAVGTCITKNNNGEVVIRAHVVDYDTYEPIDNAEVGWTVIQLDNKNEIIGEYQQDALISYGSGWYGGTSPCSLCDDGDIYIGCGKSYQDIYSTSKYLVEIEIGYEGCGSGTLVIDPDTE